LIIAGILSGVIISKHRYWYQNGNMLQVYIEDARLFSEKERPLLITDFSNQAGMTGCMVVLDECESENIDIIGTSPDIDNLDEMIGGKNYSDIFVSYASESLINNLKTQYGDKMEALTTEGTSVIWKIDDD
jgi:hypothetical protein